MGSQLSVEEALNLCVEELGLDRTHVHTWLSNGVLKINCLVDERWLQVIQTGTYTTKPQSFPGTDYEKFLLLQPSNHELPKSWKRLAIKILQKPLRKSRVSRDIKENEFLANDSFNDLMSYISTENFKNYLLQASKKYSNESLIFDQTQPHLISGEEMITEMAQLYGLKIIKLNEHFEQQQILQYLSSDKKPMFNNDILNVSKRDVSKLLPVLAIVESNNAIFILEPFIEHSLQDVIWFSPSVVTSTIAKPLFLLYQILHLFRTFHQQNYYCNVSSIQNILLGRCLWLTASISNVNLGEVMQGPDDKPSNYRDNMKTDISQYDDTQDNMLNSGNKPCISNVVQNTGLSKLVDMWVKKELSNFDYLMALNNIAGRRCGDPNYHPVLPWVTDFTRPSGNYRDLTKSKFRINKGDKQLDLTYKGMSDHTDGDLTENPPHHVSGVLSEITYHMYLARRTPKSILQKHVRAKWEPNEYPSSIQRLQEWTPDECIPEFYTDPTIFKSIHADLPDLEIPQWADTYEDFISLHCSVLESEYVCSHLHHWIDLTFGYKLVGIAAEKAKNVCLHLVDQHQSITNHGVLPLFLEPHPAQQHGHDMILYPNMINLEDGLEHELHTKTHTIDGLSEFTGEDIPSSSWDNVDVKIESADDELSMSISSFRRKLPRPNLPTFLRLKDNVETTMDAGPSIDNMPISLPIGYDPLEMFNQVQLLTKFKLQSKQNDLTIAKQNSQVKVLPKADIPDSPRIQEIQNLCCILMEIFLPSKMRLLSSNLTHREKFIAATRVFRAGQFALPGIFRHGIKMLFDEGLGFHKRQGLAPLTPELLLQSHVSVFPFPTYFQHLYDFLVEFYNEPITADNELTSAEDISQRLQVDSDDNMSCSLYQVSVTMKHLSGLLDELNEEGLDLLMTFLKPLFSCKETQLQAFLHLFEPLATNLGHKKARKVFLKLVLKQYDVKTSSLSSALFNQSFLSRLIMLFGMQEFLNHFIAFIVDALWSARHDTEASIDTYSQEEIQGVIIEDNKDGDSLTDQCYQDGNDDTILQSIGDQNSSLVTTDQQPSVIDKITDTELECDTSLKQDVDSEKEISDADDRSVLIEGQDNSTGLLQRNLSKQSFNQEDWYNDSSVDTEFSLERSVSFQSEPTEHIDHNEQESIIEEVVDNNIDICEAAAESLAWLSPRLGPVLASNYITKPLLTMLVKCFVGVVGMGERGVMIGNENAKWILHCFGRFVEIYGEAVIFHQYLPFISAKLNIATEHVSVKGEANLAAALTLVQHCLCYLSEESLLEKFQEVCHQILQQILCLLSSGTITFASGASARIFLALLTIEIFKIVCDTLERQSAQELLFSLIRIFFSSFDKAYREQSISDTNTSDLQQPCAREIQETFTASLAHHGYITLCKSLGGTYMEKTLCNHDLIWQLCCSIDTALSNNTPSITYQPVIDLGDGELSGTPTKQTDTTEHGKARPNSIIFDGSILAGIESLRKENSLERNVSLKDKDSKSSSVSTRRHLTGNWLKYWKNNLGRRSRIDGSCFSNLKLQTFTGHSDVIRDIWVQDSEHLFLSASRDKTVKLWSLSNHGGGSGQSACSWTTYDHRKPVFAVDVVDVTRQAVSCDGSLHVWDLPTGSSVLKLNCPKNNQAVAMTTLPSPNPCVVAAMQNMSVRFMDTREGDFGQSWKVTSNNVSGAIRSICVNKEGTLIAVGFSSGWLSVIDLRGGILSRQWKAYETDVIQIKSYTATSFVTSSGQKIYLWGNDGVNLASLPVPNGYGEFVNKICVNDKVIMSSMGHNRLGWHVFNADKEPSYSSVRFGSDSFKGNLTCFGVLPLNHAYLCGSDNGNITLMA